MAARRGTRPGRYVGVGMNDTQDPEIARFVGQNLDELYVAFDGAIVHFDRVNGHIRMLVEITENATGAKIKKALPAIMAWRRRLTKYQAASIWTIGGRDGLLYRLHVLNREGLSYFELAESLTQAFIRELLEYAEFERAYLAAQHRFRTLFDAWVWSAEAPGNPYGSDHAISLLADMGMTEEDARGWVEIALKDALTEAQILDLMPVSADMVKEQLRYWRKYHNIFGGKK